MMPVYKSTGIEDTAATFMARIYASDGAAAQQADVSSITYDVFDTYDGTQIADDVSLTVSAVVFDTLQTGGPWTLDSTGYNFKTTLAGTRFPTGGRTYRVEFKFTMSDAAVTHAVWDHYVEAISSS